LEIEMTTAVVIEQTVQEWGNGLGVRITAPLAKAARLARGTPIKVEVVEGGFFVRVGGKPQLSLAQKLKAFDPLKHGGEVMVTGAVGAEAFADDRS
jgi:antitoxin MazE